MSNGTDRVIQFVRETSWNDLPVAVRHQARRCLLDLFGALVAGARTPVAEIMADFAVTQFAGEEARLIAGGRRVSAVGAALANGFAANALDIDDGYRPIKGHPGACILSPLLAAAELAGDISGRELLTSLVAGYEVGIRAGLIRHATYTTYHSSGSWGAIAGAAVAGRVLGLDKDDLREALGIAEYHAPIAPMMKGIDKPCMGKDSIGWGAMVGMASALMARAGFTGVEPLFSDSPRADWIEGLGNKFEILNLYFKPYACCRWAQPAIAGALKIAREYHVMPDEIERIRVLTFEAATRLSRAHPRDTEEAQYNLSFPLAAALVDGELGPRQVLPPRISDGALLSLADRVEAVVEPAYETEFPARATASVEVILRSGTQLCSGPTEAPWQPPAAPPTDRELEAKFLWLVAPVLGAEKATQLAKLIWCADELVNVRELLDISVVGVASA